MTDPAFHQRVSELFLAMRRLPRHERDRALDEASTGDARLRAEVLDLLEHDGEEPAGSTSGDSQPQSGASSWVGGPPQSIGPYRIVSRIGSGGSGQVFLAEQERPIRRRVAVKIVPQAAVSPELAARFEVERRALERTDHPNIARVLDAGRTADGLPYLVMDYVQGRPITEDCEARGLDLARRIALMLEVADAVQHMHQRGVIHRDLKPANILVTEVDGQPTPRVLDFGIAKPVAGFASDTLSSHSPPTSGLPLGTPSYMAPEQTGLGSIDTRADVYALGAVLYELVAGRPPIDHRGDALDVLRRIRDVPPPPASRARSDAVTSAGLGRSQRSDLDLILAKALEKSPERRYDSVSALADDLRRLLRQEPIAARAPTLGYRSARFAQRNKVLVASAAAIALALALGVTGLLAGLLEANRQRAAALDQNEGQREIIRFLTDDLLAAASPDEQGADVTAIELLNRASARIGQRFTTRPLVAASIHHTLGTAYAELGAFDEAQRHIEQAIALRRAAAGVDAPDTVRSEIAAASLLVRRQKMDEGEKALIECIRRARLFLGPDDLSLYAAMNDLGVVFLTVNREKDAVEIIREALQGRVRLLGPAHRDVLITTGNLAYAYDGLGETQKALEMMHEGLRIAESLPESPRMTILGFNNNIGATYQDLGEDEKAAPYLRKAAAIAEETLGPTHPATLSIQGNLAGLESDLGDPLKAAEIYQRVADERTKQLGPDSADTLTARYGYWNAIWKARRYDEAIDGFAQLFADVASAMGETHWLTGQTEASLARALADGGRTEEALRHAEHAAATLLTALGPEHSRTTTTKKLADDLRAKIESAAP
jgi:serine/threonine protein kinase